MIAASLAAMLISIVTPESLYGGTPASQAPRSKSSEAEKIRQKVEEYGIGHRVTVVLRNGNEYYGALGEAGPDTFEISEVDLNQKITVSYNDVKKVRSGFGNPNKYNGKRWHPGWHIGALVAVIGVTVLLVVAGANAGD
jgi:hypothetical protein